MAPVFMSEGVKDAGYAKVVGSDATHLKASFNQGGKHRFDAIGFGLADRLELLENGQSVRVAYALDENEWQGRVSLQLKLKDIQS